LKREQAQNTRGAFPASEKNMSKFTERIFIVKSDEWRLVLTLGAILFINYAAMGVTKVVSVSGFLSEVQDYYILLVWAGDMALLILATGAQSLIIDKYPRVKLLGGIILLLGAIYAILPLSFMLEGFPIKVSYTLLYLLTDQQWLVFPLVFWALVNDLYSPAQGRRLLPVIGSFAFLGTIAGLIVAQLDAIFSFGAPRLLFANALAFLFDFGILYFGLRKIQTRFVKKKSDSVGKIFSGGWDFIKTVPAFRYLSLIMFSAGITLTILLYDTLSDASLYFGDNFQHFFALYSLVIAVFSVLLQFFSGKIISKLGIKNSFSFLPFALFFGSILSFIIPGIWGSAPAQGLSKITLDTVDQSNRKAYQALVPDEKRGRVSIFIDNYLPSLGTIFASLLVFGIISWSISAGLSREVYSSIYLALGIIGAIMAVIAFFLMRKVYDKSLLSWQMKRRSRSSSVMDKLDF